MAQSKPTVPAQASPKADQTTTVRGSVGRAGEAMGCCVRAASVVTAAGAFRRTASAKIIGRSAPGPEIVALLPRPLLAVASRNVDYGSVVLGANRARSAGWGVPKTSGSSLGAAPDRMVSNFSNCVRGALSGKSGLLQPASTHPHTAAAQADAMRRALARWTCMA
jgi:hypothetical protein